MSSHNEFMPPDNDEIIDILKKKTFLLLLKKALMGIGLRTDRMTNEEPWEAMLR